LAYAFWPVQPDEQNQLSTETVVSNQTPTPQMPTSSSSATAENKSKPSSAKPTPTPPRAPISGGVLNGKAISLPKPAYPLIARQAQLSGTVVVQVTLDEDGNVISAHAVSGHPLLQEVSVAAARGAKFSRTRLGGQPVKVTGVITYNFLAE